MSATQDLTIVRRLAVGGTAEIVLARRSDGQAVVIKRLLPDAGEAMVVRLAREAALLGEVHTPHVIGLYGADEETLILEHVDGTDAGVLAARLAKRGEALPLGAALAVGAGICRGLAAIHALGFVHADVSPGNVLLGRDGAVKLIDLGIARRLGAAAPSSPEGTLAYQPPEQLALQSIGETADVYAAALVVYELVTGTPARPAGQLGHAELRAARAVRPAAPSIVRPGLSAKIDDVLLDALDPDPNRRPSPREWLTALAGLPVPADSAALRTIVGQAIGTMIPAAATAAVAAQETAILMPVGGADTEPVSAISTASEATTGPTVLPSATQLRQPVGLRDVLNATTPGPIPLRDADPRLETTAPGQSWAEATNPSELEALTTTRPGHTPSGEAPTKLVVTDEPPPVTTPTPPPTRGRQGVVGAVLIAILAVAFAYVTYDRTTATTVYSPPVVPVDAPSVLETPKVVARADPPEAAPPAVAAPPFETTRKAPVRPVNRPKRRPRIRVLERGAGSVVVRARGMNGKAPQTSPPLEEGATVIVVETNGLTVPLRVSRRGEVVRVTVAAPPKSYYDVRCGLGPSRPTPIVGLVLKKRLDCAIKRADGRAGAFRLQRISE